jgi:hypothetical protein
MSAIAAEASSGGVPAGSARAIAAPVAEWEPYLLVRPLTAYVDSLRGTFTFPDSFLDT